MANRVEEIMKNYKRELAEIDKKYEVKEVRKIKDLKLISTFDIDKKIQDQRDYIARLEDEFGGKENISETDKEKEQTILNKAKEVLEEAISEKKRIEEENKKAVRRHKRDQQRYRREVTKREERIAEIAKMKHSTVKHVIREADENHQELAREVTMTEKDELDRNALKQQAIKDLIEESENISRQIEEKRIELEQRKSELQKQNEEEIMKKENELKSTVNDQINLNFNPDVKDNEFVKLAQKRSKLENELEKLKNKTFERELRAINKEITVLTEMQKKCNVYLVELKEPNEKLKNFANAWYDAKKDEDEKSTRKIRDVEPKQDAEHEEPPAQEEPTVQEESTVDEWIVKPEFAAGIEETPEEGFHSLLDDGVLDEELARTKRKAVFRQRVEEVENDDFAPIEEIFNGRKEKEGPRDTEIDIPMDEEKQKPQRVEIKRDNINQPPKRSTTITPQEHDIEVPGAGNDYSEIKISKATENKDFGISKIEISEATGNVKVFDLDGEPIFKETYDSDFVINRFDEKNKLPVKEPDTRKDGFTTCFMYGTLNDLLAKVESTCNSEEEIERSQDVDPRVINALYKIAIDRNSKEPLNYLKDYLFSMVKEKDEIDINNNVIPFQMEYNLKDIYNTDLTLEEIKKIQEVSNAAQKMNKEYVSVKKDFFAKRAFYKIKKQLVERKQNKAIAGGDAPSSKVPNKAKRIIKGIYRKAVIHGMYLKGKIKRENPKKTKLKVREYESKFMKDLDVRDYLADRQKSKSEEPKRIKTEDLEKDFSESEALDIDDDEFVLAPKNKSEYEDGDVPKEGIDFVTGGRELDD